MVLSKLPEPMTDVIPHKSRIIHSLVPVNAIKKLVKRPKLDNKKKDKNFCT